MEVETISTIPLIAHENYINRLYKVIRWLVIAIIVMCILFTGYICTDRYLDEAIANDTEMSVEQNANDNGKNLYNGGDYIVSTSDDY